MADVTAMRRGVNLPTKGDLAGPDAIATMAMRAEALGFATVWASDHIALPVDPRSEHPESGRPAWQPTIPWYDPFLALSWAAAATSSVRLGTSVLVLPLRPTLIVAKSAATLDALSQGGSSSPSAPDGSRSRTRCSRGSRPSTANSRQGAGTARTSCSYRAAHPASR